MKAFNTEAPRLNLPLAIREGGARVDFRPDISFDAQVEWHGLRYAWTRMLPCPCQPFNDQTEQVQPGCPKCDGQGWRPFRDLNFKIMEHDMGHLGPLQRHIITKDQSSLIQAITTSVSSEPDIFQAMGSFGLGSITLTVLAENRLGYYDRMTCLDALMTYSELRKMPASGNLKLRYPCFQLHALITDDVIFKEGDVEIVDGEVVFASGKRPAADTPISASFLYYPAFRVITYANAFRSSVVRTKVPKENRTKPAGDVTTYPFRVIGRLEHLPMPVGGV